MELEENAMVNTTFPTPVGVFKADYVGYVFVPLLFTLGVVGNTLTIRVMASRSFISMPVSKLLIALSVSDIGFNLLFPFNKPFIRVLLGKDIRAISSGGCKLFFGVYRFFKFSSSWIVVLISCERFVAVWVPVKAKIINTPKNAYIGIASIYLIFAITIGYWSSWGDQLIDGKCIPNTQPPGMEKQAKGFLVFGISMYAFLPGTILLVLNVLVAIKLVMLVKKKATMVAPTGNKSSHSAAHSRTTVMLICIAVAFIILVTPNSASHLVSFIRGVNIFETTDPGMVVFREISGVMAQLNHCINFLLYVLCSKRFRVQVFRLFKCKRTANGPITAFNNGTQTADTQQKNTKMSAF